VKVFQGDGEDKSQGGLLAILYDISLSIG